MPTIQVNGKQIAAKDGETILDALRRESIYVPTLCHMEGLLPSGACRLCVVEVDGARNLIPSCATPVRDGMVIQTHSPRAIRARKTVIELLLANHPDDCNYCVRNGDCSLQDMAQSLGVRERRLSGDRTRMNQDISSVAIVRDPEKCILCGRCVRVCEEVQGVSAIDFIDRGSKTHIGAAFEEGLNVSSCVYCGQCVKVCPTGALREHSALKEVIAAIQDPTMHVVIQHAPAVSVTIGEEFNVKPGVDCAGALTAALRRIGFDRVFDTSFSADLTIMEEAAELVHRVKTGGKLPMFTSCSPAWIKFVETFYPEFIGNLSTCKSPQMMLGAVIKSYYAQKHGIDPKKIFSVSVMPCTAKKFEAKREEMESDGVFDIDAVLTTRELARLIQMRGLDIQNLEPETADTPFGDRSTAGKLFGASGGVMEAAVRTAYFMLTGKELEDLTIKAVRGLDGIKTTTLDINGLKVGIAVVSGLGNARKLLDEIRDGRNDIHFIEIMSCPGGCINGGGQPVSMNMDAIKKRMKALYDIDKKELLRTSHANPSIKRIYDEFLGEPLGEKSHHLLHTHYVPREVLK
ncbi:MAG: NADH-dependent [FeFe] hydrogenase, group A6 [Planctomycetota bacterium]